jgi:hypothetical protein
MVSFILGIISMIVIGTLVFSDSLTEMETIQYILVWGFLFLGSILTGMKITTQILIPKDLDLDKINSL